MRILFLAPYSIPVNNPEAICNAKLLRELSRFYKIDVISKNNLSAYAPNSNDEFFIGKVESLKTFFLSNRINWRTLFDHFRVLLKTGYTYKGAHWAYYSIIYAEKLIRQYRYDWIMSRSPSSELAALYLSKKYDIKWIANWIDPYPEEKFPYPYGKGPNAKLSFFKKKLLKQVIKYADIHTFPCERLRDYMLQYMSPVSKEKMMIIPHICVNGLFQIQQRFDSDKLLIVHSGNVSYPRNPDVFFEGVKKFIDKSGKPLIKIFFIGKQDLAFEERVKKNDLCSYVEIVKPLEYIENLKFIARCDIALLIEAPCKEGVFLPTKVGDYMQCEKDIFAISPSKGTLHDLYEKGVVKYFADCSDSERVCDMLDSMYAKRFSYIKRENNPSPYLEYSTESVIHLYRKILS